jgi:hypothetical protein
MLGKSREVGIRLSVKDKEVAERALKQFGKEGQSALHAIEAAGRPASGSLLAVNAAVNAGRIGVRNFVAGAIAGAAPILSFSAALNGAKDALSAFDTIAKQAKAAGLDGETFQELGYAAELGGVGVDELAAATATFAKNAGLAVVGKGRMVTALKALNPELLENIRNAKSQEERIRLVADALRDEEDASRRAALASAAFGDVGARVVEAFKGGSGELDGMARKARELGIVVSNEVLASAEQMSDEFETATKVIDIKLKQALVNLGPVLVWLAQQMSSLTEGLATVLEQFDAVENRTRLRPLQNELIDIQNRLPALAERIAEAGKPGGRNRYLNQMKEDYDGLIERALVLQERIAQLQGKPKDGVSIQDAPATEDLPDLPPIGSDDGKAALKEALALMERLRTATEVYADTVKDLDDKRAAGLIGQDTYNRALAEAVMAFADAADGTAEYAAAMEELNAAREAGILSEKKYTAAVEDLTRKRLVAQNDWLAGLQMGLMDIAGETDQVTTEVGSAVKNWANSLGDAIGQVFRTGKFEWRDLVTTMLADIAKLVTQQTITRPLAGLLGSLFGSALGGAGGGGNGFIPGITGPSLIGNNAGGTDFWRGGPTWVGEKGPEIINLPRGAQVIPNHKLGSIGGMSVTLAPTYHVDGSGLSEAQLGRVLQANNEELLRRVPGVVKKAIGNGVFG